MTRDQLLASLTAAAPDAWYPGDEDDARYMDWSTRTADGGYTFEVGEGDDAVQLELTRAELAEIVQALTITLLAES